MKEKTSLRIDKFLNNSEEYPFNTDKSFIIYKINKDDETIINEMIQNIYVDVDFYKYRDFFIAFAKEFNDVKDMFQAFIVDLQYEINVHEGFRLRSQTKGHDLKMYIDYYIENLSASSYTNFVNICILANNNNKEIIKIIKNNVLDQIIKNEELTNLIQVFFKNNLNVSQTSKLIYMHRNSLINKLDKIEKLTSLNIQNFHDAYAMKILLDLEE